MTTCGLQTTLTIAEACDEQNRALDSVNPIYFPRLRVKIRGERLAENNAVLLAVYEVLLSVARDREIE